MKYLPIFLLWAFSIFIFFFSLNFSLWFKDIKKVVNLLCI